MIKIEGKNIEPYEAMVGDILLISNPNILQVSEVKTCRYKVIQIDGLMHGPESSKLSTLCEDEYRVVDIEDDAVTLEECPHPWLNTPRVFRLSKNQVQESFHRSGALSVKEGDVLAVPNLSALTPMFDDVLYLLMRGRTWTVTSANETGAIVVNGEDNLVVPRSYLKTPYFIHLADHLQLLGME
jgi:hypothetical protein